jgi:hypothetical protein
VTPALPSARRWSLALARAAAESERRREGRACVAVVQQMGWQLDTATGMLTVVTTHQDTHTTTPNQLQRLTEYVVHLEG